MVAQEELESPILDSQSRCAANYATALDIKMVDAEGIEPSLCRADYGFTDRADLKPIFGSHH